MRNEIEDHKKERGTRSPAFSLNEAVGFLEAVITNLGLGPISREAIAKALGHKAITGSVTTKIGSLTHFGLLDREKGVYKASELAKRILRPENDTDRQTALIEAAKTPTLYSQLVANNSGQKLPQMLANTLFHNHGVIHDNAEDVAKTFRQSMEFCGLLRHGVLHSQLSEPGNSDSESSYNQKNNESNSVTSSERANTKKQTHIASHDDLQEYAIPLTKKRCAILQMPLPLEESDVDRIKGWLDLMKDVLVSDTDEGMENQ